MKRDDKLFVLTGAGISAESGLPTFRSPHGIWQNNLVQQVCTSEAWEQDPWRVWQFYAFRRSMALKAKPNPAHIALAELEAAMGDRFFLCTQNVDNLHEQAGSKRLAHIHGEIHKSRCSGDCSEPVEDTAVYKLRSEIPRCYCGALMRPHIVLFGEYPLNMEQVEDTLEDSTIMLVVGTSGVVQPAASLVGRAKRRGIRTVYVGLEEPKNASKFSEVILGEAGKVLPSLLL